MKWIELFRSLCLEAVQPKLSSLNKNLGAWKQSQGVLIMNESVFILIHLHVATLKWIYQINIFYTEWVYW